MNRHTQTQELINRLLDEDPSLSTEETAALQAHLAECADCAAVYAAFSALSEQLGADLVEPPTSLRENVMAEVRREEIRRKNRRRFRWTGLAAAAAVAVLVLGFAPRVLQTANNSTASVKHAAGFVHAAPAEVYAEEAADALLAPAAESAAYGEYAAESAPRADRVVESACAAEAEAYEDAGPSPGMDALLVFLDGREIEEATDTPAEAEYRIETDDGALTFWLRDGTLFYTDPRSGALCASGRSVDELLAFLREQGA